MKEGIALFNFNFVFSGTPFPLLDIFLGVLTVGGTALATFLAARYTGKNANDIAEKSNEFQQQQLYEDKKEDAVIQFLVNFNTLIFAVTTFYDFHNDDRRVKALSPLYKKEYVHTSPKHRSYIDIDSIKIKNVNDLGEEVLNQTKELDTLNLEMDNSLIKIKRYPKKDDFEFINKKVSEIFHYFRYIRTSAYSYARSTKLDNHLIAVQLVHLVNDVGEIAENRKTDPNFTTSADPFLQALFRAEAYKEPVNKIIKKYLN